MKVTTDPETGATTCELSTQDRKSMAVTKTAFEKLAHYLRGTRDGRRAQRLATETGDILAGRPAMETEEAK